tara:strand:- start:899 stop:2020 length:1122 start_codon:yes stop_codon:yes gene_type:complete
MYLEVRNCRVCNAPFNNEELLHLENMPKSAQNFPVDKNDKGIELSIYQCSACGLVQHNCPPVPYHKEVIRASAFSTEMSEFRKLQFNKFVHRYYLKGKKVIELGCGRGEYLSLMKETGANVSGIEYSIESVNECLKQNLNVKRDYISDSNQKLPDAPYDAFFILSYFEHLPAPQILLKSIHKNLTNDGIGLIEVPNFDMMVRDNLFSEFITDHLMYFTKDTLTSTLLMNGFEVVECKEIWHDYIISAVVRKRNKLNLQSFKNEREVLTTDIHNYISQHSKVAVFGAGHQALALIALTDIGNKIEYVVDDATFKQGKYTPATHIPIVSRAELKKNPVDAIIIIAGSYSDEVKNSLSHTKINKAIINNNKLQVAS